jgi:hypothetical protein
MMFRPQPSFSLRHAYLMTIATDLRRLYLVLALTFVVRLCVLIPGFGALNDPDNYLQIAHSLAEGRGFCLESGRPTAYRPPLYPLILAPLIRLGRPVLPWGIAALHVTLGLGSVALTFVTARRWGLNPNRSTLAALIVALDPVSAVWTRSVMTETLAAFLVACCLAAVTISGRRGLIAGGLAFGLAALCRPSLLPGACLYGAALFVLGTGDWKRRLSDCALFAAIVLVTLLPWAVRNARLFGEPVWTTTHGGHTLALANNPVYFADVVDGPPGAVWSGATQAQWFARLGRELKGMGEPRADRYLRRLALSTIVEHPRTFFRASLARLGRFWGIAPSAAVYSPWLRFLSAIWTLPLWFALAIGLWHKGLWLIPKIAAPLIIIALTAIHTVYWTDMRMRVPVITAIALVAAGTELTRRPWRRSMTPASDTSNASSV